MLGLMQGRKVKVLASLEHHATHGGVHCHAPCDREADPPSGAHRYPGMGRAPSESSRRNAPAADRMVPDSNMTAWHLALKFYNAVDANGEHFL